MPISLSIKNVPDDIAAALKSRAQAHRRSLQKEIMAILEQAVGKAPARSSTEILKELRTLGLKTPSESVKIIRADRDSR